MSVRAPAGVQLACIGAGSWGRNLVRNFEELGALAWVCEVDRGTREELAQKYPLEAGKDVMVEKPLCLDAGEGQALVALAERKGRVLMVGHLLWYHPAVLKLRELVASGELGRIQYIYSNRLNLGRIRREENILWSFAPHDISVILGLLGEMPDTVQAQGGNYLHDRIADVTVSLLAFPSGVRAHIFVSWLHPFDGRRLSHQTLEEMRIRAVQRVEAGESPEVVIRALGFARARIYQWMAR